MTKYRVLLFIALFFIILSSCNNNCSAPAGCNMSSEQKEAIERTIGYYAEGIRIADGSVAANAFTENATMSWTENGKLVSVPIQTLFDIINDGVTAPTKFKVTS
jgi:hypothetical protein